MSLVLRDVLDHYSASVCGESLGRRAGCQHGDYIAWLQEQDVASAAPFWRSHLDGFAGASSLRLQASLRPVVGYGNVETQLTASATTGLTTYARDRGLTLSTLLQGAWSLVLEHYSGSADNVVGIVASGREIALDHVDEIVGLFVATLPMRIKNEPDRPFRAWLEGLQGLASSIRDYEHVPLASIQEWSGLPRGTPLFETLFVVSNYPQDIAPPGCPLRVAPGDFRTVPAYPITVLAVPGEQLLVRLVYDRQRYSEAAVAEMLGRYCELLSAFVLTQDDAPLASVLSIGLRGEPQAPASPG